MYKRQDQDGTILNVEQKKKQQPPPLPYNLSSLQIDAARRFGMNAKLVLDTCQALYERHKLITYPRSDCRYLPEEHYAEAVTVTAAIQKTCQPLQQAVAGADVTIKTKAWNDKKVSAHHAIIPTHKSMAGSRLSGHETNIYDCLLYTSPSPRD